MRLPWMLPLKLLGKGVGAEVWRRTGVKEGDHIELSSNGNNLVVRKCIHSILGHPAVCLAHLAIQGRRVLWLQLCCELSFFCSPTFSSPSSRRASSLTSASTSSASSSLRILLLVGTVSRHVTSLTTHEAGTHCVCTSVHTIACQMSPLATVKAGIVRVFVTISNRMAILATKETSIVTRHNYSLWNGCTSK